jgi:hypothetical protein
VHTRPSEDSVRPFFSVGAGVKAYRGTGQEVTAQPLGSIALLTRTTDLRALISVGAGVKWQISHGVQLRAEVRDLMTPFPTGVIAPLGGRAGSWFHNLVPLFGISYGF